MKQNSSVLERMIEEPYRFFFMFGILAGIIGVGHWLVYALGWIPTYSMIQHSGIQIHAYMGSFIIGFLLTAVPRFSSSRPCGPFEFSFFVVLMTCVLCAYSRGNIAAGRLFFLAVLAFLLFFLGKRLVKDKPAHIQPPLEFVWISVGVLHAIAGILFELGHGPAWMLKAGKQMMEQGFLLAIVLGVGSFMGPRIMGTFKTPIRPLPDGKYSDEDLKRIRLRLLTHLSGAVLFFISFILEGHNQTQAAYLLRSAIILFFYFSSGTLVLKPKMKEQYVWMIWLSFWMVGLGYTLAALFPPYRAMLIHMAFLGGFSLMTFGIGTMVIFSHSGKQDRLLKFSWPLAVLTGLLLISMTVRMLSVFFPEYYFQFLGTASALWLFAAVLWVWNVFPWTIHVLGREEFEQCHDEAKARISEVREKVTRNVQQKERNKHDLS